MYHKRSIHKKAKTEEQLRQSWCSFNARRLRENSTPSERALIGKLTEAGFLHYRFQQIFRTPDVIYFADFFLRKPLKLVIEVDGEYHKNSNQRIIDRKKDWFYINNPNVHSVLRMTDQQAIDISINDLRSLITNLSRGTIKILYEL